MRHFRREAGAALLIALVLSFAAVAVAVALATAQSHTQRRAQNLFAEDRAWGLVAALELAAEASVREQRAISEAGGGARVVAPEWLRTEVGSARAVAVALQSRFNLNNLMTGNRINEGELGRFRALLRQLELEPGIAEAVVDWIDRDGEPRPGGGAEDDYYSRLPRPYRAANRPFTDPSELLLVRGVTRQAFAALRPFVCTLPGRLPIDLNTAPEVVIQALHPDMSHLDALALIDARRQSAFATVKDALVVGSLAKLGIPLDSLTVAGRYYEVTSDVEVDRTRLRVVSVLDVPDTGEGRVVRRTRESG
jgi:general secretion pathway protein K